MANPIRRLVQLVLDKTTAKRTENDAKKSLKGVEGSLDGVRKMAMRVGAALAAAFGVRAIAGFLKSSVKAASEAEGIWNRLGHAVEGAGIRYQAVEQDIRAMAAAMQDATKVGDEEFAATLTELITTSKDYEGSLRNISLVADLAAAKQIDLRSAAQLVGRAMVGQTGTLARYGIVVKEGEDAIEVMRASFAGFAANEATTFEGKLVQVNNAWGDFKEALGDALIAGADGETMLDRLTRAVQSLTEAVDVFGRAYAGVSETAFRNQGAITRIVAGAQTPEQALRGLATYQEVTAKELEDARTKLEGMTGAWATIKGTLKKGDFFSWQTEVESARESVDGLEETMAHLKRVMEDIEAGRLSVGSKKNENAAPVKRMEVDALALLAAIIATEKALRDAQLSAALMAPGEAADAAAEEIQNLSTKLVHLNQLAKQFGGKGGLLLASNISEVTPGLLAGRGTRRTTATKGRLPSIEQGLLFGKELAASPFLQTMNDLEKAQQTSHTMAEMLGVDYDALDSRIQNLTSSMRALADQGIGPTDARMQGLADRLRDVKKESDLVARQQLIMGEVGSAVGETLNAAFGAGIPQLAAVKAKQNAIMALEQAAMGFVASLNPFTAPLAAGHYAAAGQFAGIAAAWGTLAGVTGGFGGGGTGGFSGTGRSGAGLASERAQPPGAEVSIYLVGEGFDAINPRVQRVVHQAGKLAQESYGANARVRTFRGTIPQGGRP